MWECGVLCSGDKVGCHQQGLCPLCAAPSPRGHRARSGCCREMRGSPSTGLMCWGNGTSYKPQTDPSRSACLGEDGTAVPSTDPPLPHILHPSNAGTPQLHATHPGDAPAAQAQQPERGLKAGRAFGRVSSCVSGSGFFPFSFWPAQVGSVSSLGVLPSCPLVRARLTTGHREGTLLGSVPGQRVKTRGFQSRPGKSHPAAAPCPRVTPWEGFLSQETQSTCPGSCRGWAARECPGVGETPELCPRVRGAPGDPGSDLAEGEPLGSEF